MCSVRVSKIELTRRLASLARPPARHPLGGGLSFAVFRAATASTNHTSATAARRSLAASFTSFGCGSAMSAVCAIACHRPSIHHLRPSATVAAWHPGPAAPFRGKASARLDCISLPPACVATAPRHLRPLVFARLHPRPGKRRSVPAASPAASRCSPSLATLPVCLGYCPTDSGGATTDQHYCHVHRRKPARLRRAGSRLGFYRSPVTAMSSSHRLTAARFRPLPGETRLTKGFCPFPPPIRQ